MANISIHPPRAGRDAVVSTARGHFGGFQSTRPVRGGTRVFVIAKHIVRFQSTRPVRGGTHSFL